MNNLEKRFDQAMLRIYQRAKAEAHYTASIFFNMLSKQRGLATAKYLINTPKPSEGYTALFERGRLDLTVEAEVIDNPEWHELFSDEELAKAKARLKQYEYQRQTFPKKDAP